MAVRSDDSRILGRPTGKTGCWYPRFQRNVLLATSKGDNIQKTMNELICQIATRTHAHTHTHTQSTQHMLTWHSEPSRSLTDKPGTFLQNSGLQQPCYSAQHPRTPESSTSTLWKIDQAPTTNWALLRYIRIGNGWGEWIIDIDTLPRARWYITRLLRVTSQHAVHCLHHHLTHTTIPNNSLS